jgi:UPF0755 protein
MNMRAIFIFLVTCFILLISYLTYALFIKTLNDSPDEFTIQPNETTPIIAQNLENQKLIPSAFSFRLLVKLLGKGTSLKAGHYQFSQGDSANDILEKIVSGKGLTIAITVPEGLTNAQLMALLTSQKGILETSPTSMSQVPEASFFPETYHFHPPVPLSIVLEKMTLCAKKIYKTFTHRPLPPPLTSFQQALILASIVEKEAALDHERPLIARVFLNRLKKGMPLQADPCLVYALSNNHGVLERPLTQSDLKMPHPYNTYLNKGLPPGPICAPSYKSLDAVFSPAVSNALYFVTDGNKGHRFAATLRQHNRNVALYRRQQKA